MMARVLILGANGQLARNTTRVLLGDPALTLTLYLRRANRLKNPAPERVAIVEGDVLDAAALRRAMQDQDVVYANLAGDMERQARVIIDAMHATGLKTADLHQLHGHLWRGAGREIPQRPRSLPAFRSAD